MIMYDINGHEILTLRDYFAAHAPCRPDIPDSFIRPPYPEYPVVITDGLTLEDQGQAHAEAARKYNDMVAAHNLELQRLSMKQEVDWRYEYADAMIARRDQSS